MSQETCATGKPPVLFFPPSSRGPSRGSGGIAAVASEPTFAELLQSGFAIAAARAPATTAPVRVAVEVPVSPPLHGGGLSARRLIRSGEISIELSDYADGARKADAIARSFGGYVAQARSSVSADHASGSLGIRVPADRFDEAFRALGQLGKVRAQEIHSQDVSKEYFDLETRVRVKRDAEARMRDVLRDRTAKLSEIVEAERELTRIVEEIEKMEGERLFYDQQIAMSTIALDLSEPGAVLAATEPSILAPIRTALKESAFLLASSVAGLIYALAAGLPWGALIVLVWMLGRRIRTRVRRSVQQPT